MSTELEAQQKLYTEHQINEPHSPVGIFELPCGYVGGDGSILTEVQIREITGKEEDLLGAKNISSGKKLTQLIGNCLERLGPITDKQNLFKIANELTVGDRAFLMLAIRRVTLGDIYPFQDKCTECGAKSLYQVNLGALEVKKTPNPGKRIFEVKLPSGKSARYHLMTGVDDEALSKVDQNDQMSAAIWVRLDSIDGNPVSIEAVKAMSMRDRTALREDFEQNEGGVDTGLELTCPACGADFKSELNPGQTGFFFPSKVLRR